MKKIKQLLNNKEVLLYIVFGLLTTIINIGLFYILNKIGIIYIVSNIIALIIAKTTAYLCNKFFVFKKRCKNKKELTKEIISFIFWRSFTMLVDFFGLILLVDVFDFNKMIGKIIVTTIVITINYFTSKKIVFKN